MTGSSGRATGTARPSRAAAREARRRRVKRRQQLIGVGAVLTLLVGGGTYVAVAGSDGGNTPEGKDPAASPPPATSRPQPLSGPGFLVDAAGAKTLSAGAWAIRGTSEGSKAPERSFTCQGQRFADPTGVRTWVRQFTTPGAKETAVQYVELSADPNSAKRAYSTIVGWLGNCVTPQQRLISSYTASGLGERGTIAIFAQPVGGDKERYRTIAVTGTGPATMVVEHNAVLTAAPKASGVLNTAAAALRRICAETEATCSGALALKPALLPATGEPPGFMAPIDLPVVSKLTQPWVGVDAGTTAGSGCEKMDLAKFRSRKAKARTYVVPNAKVPAEFGVDTMVVEFASVTAAQSFVTTTRAAVDRCATTQSNAKVRRTLRIDDRGITGQTWRVMYDLGGSSRLTLRVGIVRTGLRAVHVMFPVSPGLDITDRAFADAVVRAGERSLSYR